jgi:hypothetical protein
MSDGNTFRELIDEYNDRSKPKQRLGPEVPGELFFDHESGKLYIAGPDAKGELVWFLFR